MLQTVRKYTQGWVATVMGLILTFAFVLWGIENYLSGNSKKNLAAKVNGVEITSPQLEATYQRLVMHLKDQFGNQFTLSDLMQKQLKAQALNNLVTETVLSQAAIKTGFRITPTELSAMIKQMPIFLESGHFSKERFEQIIPRMGYSKNEFFADVSQTLLLNQVASGIIGTSLVLPNEASRAIELIEQRRDIEYTILPAKPYKQAVQVTDVEVDQFYQQHPDQFTIPPKVQLEYLELSVADLKKTVAVTPGELKEYFDANKAQNSNDPKNIAKAKEVILQQKVEQTFLTNSDKLSDLSYTHPDSLKEAATALNLPIKTTEYFSKNGGTNSFTKNPKIIAAAFSGNLLKAHENSNLIEASPGTVVVFRIKDYQLENVQPISTVTNKIKDQLITEKVRLKAKQVGDEIVASIKTKDDFKHKLTGHAIVQKMNIIRQEKNLDNEILQLAFRLSPTLDNPVGGVQLANGDYAIVLLKASHDLPQDKISDKQKSSMNKLYADTYGKVEYDLYIEKQLRKAKIKVLSPN